MWDAWDHGTMGDGGQAGLEGKEGRKEGRNRAHWALHVARQSDVMIMIYQLMALKQTCPLLLPRFCPLCPHVTWPGYRMHVW